MRIARQPAHRLQLAAKMFEVLFGQPSFEKGPRIHAGRGVALKVDQIAAVAVVATPPKKVIEADFVECGRGGERRNVTAETVEMLVGPMDHRHRVPADDALDPPLQLAVARISRLMGVMNRVDVGRVQGIRQLHAFLPGLAIEHRQKLLDALRALGVQHVFERIEPLLGFDRIDVLRRDRRHVRPVAVSKGCGCRGFLVGLGIGISHRVFSVR